ncbi:hypothetical protein [Frigoribacterium sp. PhB24]|uniref:hypothetical protein n=1 Tax=Frigoribacterium sp. PhB24 TaxID=2485204 RepID=UPI000F474A34|nr:hypothetical protein [Frigoribacterium sp. PhB24]ROS54498.1 hypothetical protein EDF50_0585 [Frigoribacterium sp. PhB24]
MSDAGLDLRHLEERYRRVLRWYPGRWRRSNEEAIVGTLLDVAEAEGRERPRRAEMLDLAANGLAARVTAVFPAEAREQAASFALATGVAWSLVYFIVQDWMPWNPRAQASSLDPFGPFASAGVLVTALWVSSAVLVLMNRSTAARVSTLGASLLAVVLIASQTGSSPDYVVVHPSPDRVTFVLLAGLGIIAAAGTQRRNRTTAAASAAWFVTLAGALLVMHRVDRVSVPSAEGLPSWYDFFNRYLWAGGLLSPGVTGILIVIALSAAVGARLAGHRLGGTIVLSVAPWMASVLTNWAVSLGGDPSTLGMATFSVVVWVALSIAALASPRRTTPEERAHGAPGTA